MGTASTETSGSLSRRHTYAARRAVWSRSTPTRRHHNTIGDGRVPHSNIDMRQFNPGRWYTLTVVVKKISFILHKKIRKSGIRMSCDWYICIRTIARLRWKELIMSRKATWKCIFAQTKDDALDTQVRWICSWTLDDCDGGNTNIDTKILQIRFKLSNKITYL